MTLGRIEFQRQTDSKAMPASSTMMELPATNTDWSTQHRAPDWAAVIIALENQRHGNVVVELQNR